MKINKKRYIVLDNRNIRSGKTTIGKKILIRLKKYGKTILLSGDDLRNLFQFKKIF